MKIVYIYTALTLMGGVDRVLINKANYLADTLGYDIYIITDSQCGKPTVFPLSPNVHHIDLEINFNEQYKYGIIKRFVFYKKQMKEYRKKLEQQIKTIRPNFVISTCGRDLDFLTEIKDGSKKIGESHIARQYCRNFHLMEAKGGIYKLVANYWRKKQERAIAKLDAFVVLTKHDAESWEPVKKAEIIPNPLSFTPKEQSKCTEKRIISVGRLTEQKGYERLIEAWSKIANKYPDWVVDVYGEGEQKEWLKKLIIDYNIGDSFTIYPPTSNIQDKYLESSIYVMSSRFEGLPIVLLEAISCGLPCISFDCPHGPSEIIENGKTGILVENGNVEKLTEAIEELIIHEEKRIKMGKQAHISSQRYSHENIMKLWINLFDRLKG